MGRQQLGAVLTGSACKDIDESTIIKAVDVWTAAAGMRVVRKFTDMLLAPPCLAMWTPWESARSHATFESTAELLMVTMSVVGEGLSLPGPHPTRPWSFTTRISS